MIKTSDKEEWVIAGGEWLRPFSRVIVIKQTWMWHVSTSEWYKGPDLPSRVCCGSMVSSSDKRSAFMVGGKYSPYRFDSMDVIHKLRCAGNTPNSCHWTVISARLKYPHQPFLVVSVPAKMITCDTNYHKNGACHYRHILQIGDGLCDDDSNIPGCLFDGGDCCMSTIASHFCFRCLCHLTNVSHPIQSEVMEGTTLLPKSCDVDLLEFAHIGIYTPAFII